MGQMCIQVISPYPAEAEQVLDFPSKECSVLAHILTIKCIAENHWNSLQQEESEFRVQSKYNLVHIPLTSRGFPQKLRLHSRILVNLADVTRQPLLVENRLCREQNAQRFDGQMEKRNLHVILLPHSTAGVCCLSTRSMESPKNLPSVFGKQPLATLFSKKIIPSHWHNGIHKPVS